MGWRPDRKSLVGADLACFFTDAERGTERYVLIFKSSNAYMAASGSGDTLKQTFRSKVDTRAGTVLSSATPVQVMDRRAKAMEAVPANSNRKPMAQPA